MEIIDCRLRPPFGNYAQNYLFEYAQKGILDITAQQHGTSLPPSAQAISMELLIQEMTEVHITQGIFAVRKFPQCDNAVLEDLELAYPNRFIGFAGMSPHEGLEACSAQIDQYVLHGPAKGIALEPALDEKPWYADDKIAYPLYEICHTHHIPIVMTYGGRHPADASYYLPMAIEHVAKDFPELTLLLCHGGWPWTTASCSLALNYKHVYLCTDMYMINAPGYRDYVDAANYFLQNKLLFGSAYPLISLKDAVQFYCQCGIQTSVLPKVMHDNAQQALNL